MQRWMDRSRVLASQCDGLALTPAPAMFQGQTTYKGRALFVPWCWADLARQANTASWKRWPSAALICTPWLSSVFLSGAATWSSCLPEGNHAAPIFSVSSRLAFFRPRASHLWKMRSCR